MMKRTLASALFGLLLGTLLLGVADSQTINRFSIVNAITGYRHNSVATSGQYLRGDGTNIVLAGLNVGDAASGTLPLARGGTNATSFTAARCVRVNAGGTALEAASADCSSLAIGGAVASGTEGSVLFLGSGGALAQDNAAFFWLAASDALGLRTNANLTEAFNVFGNIGFSSGAGVAPDTIVGRTAATTFGPTTSNMIDSGSSALPWRNVRAGTAVEVGSNTSFRNAVWSFGASGLGQTIEMRDRSQGTVATILSNGFAEVVLGRTDVAVTLQGSLVRLNATTSIEDQKELRFHDLAGAEYSSFKSPATLAAIVNYILPPDDGDAGEQLQTDGAGVLTWEAAGAGGSGYATIQEDGVGLTQRTTLNFAGTSITCADDGGTKTTCTIGGGGGSGDVVGPASATDNALARFDATTGKLIQNSGAILSDANALSGITVDAAVVTSGSFADARIDNNITVDLAATATALAANGANCGAGNYPLGVDASGAVEGCTAAGGGGTPGGSTTQFQYNNAGAFAGTAGFTWDAATQGATLAGGTLPDDGTKSWAKLTGTLPTTPSAPPKGMLWEITTAGSAAVSNFGLFLDYKAGYTGSANAVGFQVQNAALGTGTNLQLNVAAGTPAANIGQQNIAYSEGAGYKIGNFSEARGSTGLNAGLFGKSAAAVAGSNIGVLGNAANSTEGTDLVNVGVLATLDSALPAANVSAALLGAVASGGVIFRGYADDTELLRVDTNTTASETALLVSIAGGAVQRVSVGAADSGGSGFRMLRVPN